MDLSLPTENWMQDWPLEVADGTRLREFVDYYCRVDIDDDIRFAVMELVLASFDGACSESMTLEWPRIRDLLRQRPQLHAYTIYEWACWDAEDLGDIQQQFRSSAFLREIEI